MGVLLTKSEMQQMLYQQLARDHANKEKQAYEFMSLNAAHFLLSNDDPDCPVDSDELKQVASQLKACGMRDYGARCYGESKENVDDIRFEGFVLKHLDSLKLPRNFGENLPVLKTKLQQRIQERGETCGEYTLHEMKKLDDGRKDKPYKEKDCSVYEFEASEDDWKLAVCCANLANGEGGKVLKEEEIEVAKKNPFARFTLRNKRNIEKMHRGELGNFAEEFNKTRNSFFFADEDHLEQAKECSGNILETMRGFHGELSRDPKWQRVLQAAEGFTNAETPEAAAKKSAEILVAVEGFTKGRKSNYKNKETRDMVKSTLDLLAASIPAARTNPSVKPLIDRFNEVRAHRLQSRVELVDYGFTARDPEAGDDEPELRNSDARESNASSDELSPAAREIYNL